MSRLIDADVMHREIDKYNLEGRMSLKNIKRYIDAQPTAYDIDKVVEQLEEMSVNYCREYGYAEDENILYLPDVIKTIKGSAE